MQSLPVHRSILAVDIEASTSPLRTNPVKEILRREVYRVLAEAMAFAGILDHHLDPLEDRGDGVLALIRPADEVPKTVLLGALVPELERLLWEYNDGIDVRGGSTGLGLRLRVALHAGEVHRDRNGFFGEEVDVCCRLLDAPRFKKELALMPGPLALVISEDLYWSVVRHDYAGVGHADFQQLVRVRVSGRLRLGWVLRPAGLLVA